MNAPWAKTASWILLALIGVPTLLISFVSAWVAYSAPAQDVILPGVTAADVAKSSPEQALAHRGRRGTAAAYAAAYATLLLFIVFGPYRRGEVWAWWAILASAILLGGMILLRIPLLGIQGQVNQAILQLGLTMVALVLGSGRLKST